MASPSELRSTMDRRSRDIRVRRRDTLGVQVQTGDHESDAVANGRQKKRSTPQSIATPDPVELFRPDALAAQAEAKLGSPSGFHPVSWTVLTAFLAILFTSAAVFLVTQSYARKETVRGVLRAEGGELRVTASRGGTIRELHVREGAIVSEGAVLVVISTAQRTEAGAVADEVVLDSLAQEESRLKARLQAFDEAQPLEVRGLVARRAGLIAQQAAALNGKEIAEQRLALAESRLAASETLAAKGLVPAEEMQRRRELVLALRQAISDAAASAAAFAAQIAELDAVRARRPLESAQTRTEILRALNELDQRRAQAEAGKGYVLRAGRSGRVTALQAALGQQADPQRPLMTITPLGASLQAELYVPSRAIGFVEPGQSVRLLYDAFPYQRFGAGAATVTAISATALAPAEVTALLAVEEPVYRIVATLQRKTIRAFGRDHALGSGMALTADIVLEERTFAEWLLEPLYAMRARNAPRPQQSDANDARPTPETS